MLLEDSGIAAVVTSLLDGLDELSGTLTTRIRAEVGFYQVSDAVPEDSLWRSVHDNVAVILHQFVSDTPPDLSAPRRTGRLRAQQGAPLPEVVRAYRVAFAGLWEALVARARESGQLDDAQLVDVAGDVWRLIGTYSDAMADAYTETASQLTLEREHERSVLVEALFSGVIVTQSTLWETAQSLRLPLEGCFVVVAAENPALGRQSLPGIESRLQADGVRSAWRLLPDEQVGVLSLPDPGANDRIPGLLSGRASSRIGLSPAYEHLRDTPRALRLARLALGTLPAGEAGVARTDDTPIAVLVAAAPMEAGRVASGVLGPLLTLPAADRKVLLRTLETWFACTGSASDAGKELYCHPNTVRYRLRRIEELTGRSLQDPKGLAELATALQVVRLTPGQS